jgi:hypothetical protein
MKHVIFILGLTLSICVNAQVTKCKYDENEFDSFNGRRIVKTKFYPLGKTEKSNTQIQAAVRKVDSTYFILMTGVPGQCVSDHDTEVSFKILTGEIFTLKHIGEIDCGRTIYVGAASAHTAPMIMLHVDKEGIRKLGIGMIRISDGTTYSNIQMALPFTLKQIFDCADSAPEARK